MCCMHTHSPLNSDDLHAVHIILAWSSILRGSLTLNLVIGFSWSPFTGQIETFSQYWKIIHIETFRLVIPTPSVAFWDACISPSFPNDLGTWLTSPPKLLLSSRLVTPHFGFSVPYFKWSFSFSATLAHGDFLDLLSPEMYHSLSACYLLPLLRISQWKCLSHWLSKPAISFLGPSAKRKCKNFCSK